MRQPMRAEVNRDRSHNIVLVRLVRAKPSAFVLRGRSRSAFSGHECRLVPGGANARDGAGVEFQEVSFYPVAEDEAFSRHIRFDHEFLARLQDSGTQGDARHLAEEWLAGDENEPPIL